MTKSHCLIGQAGIYLKVIYCLLIAAAAAAAASACCSSGGRGCQGFMTGTCDKGCGGGWGGTLFY